MKAIMWLVYMFTLLITTCLPSLKTNHHGSDQVVDWRVVIMDAKFCYETEHGVNIFSTHNCPVQAEIEDETARFLIRLSLSHQALKGVQYYFTPYWLEQLNIGVGPMYGITLNDQVAVGRLGGVYYEWMDTYCHELGHIILMRAMKNPGFLHYNYPGGPCDANPTMDECELLPAATAIGVSVPSLSEDNEYRRAFEKL